MISVGVQIHLISWFMQLSISDLVLKPPMWPHTLNFKYLEQASRDDIS